MTFEDRFTARGLVELMVKITEWAKERPAVTIIGVDITEDPCTWEVAPYPVAYTAKVRFIKEEKEC